MSGGNQNKFVNFLSNTHLLKAIGRSTDLLLALFIVTIIMMIIIPVSPNFIDAMIALNLTISLILLMVALYIPRAVNLSIFPSLLLLTTLFRLGIEISATRQILLHADAGHIIYAFGGFVVGGNFVVGGVVFLIITIVQFIVVTKGAERVAEVAARFTLDAMPGKQMSIDADMRSGVIDATKARDLRLALTKESQLYGAMDGAMKFVKGDVIAAIIIAVINIVGGLVIGRFMHGMTTLQAAQTYAILSIGSGLVSQIPSLMVALTAGIITTRVSSDKQDDHLAKEITAQLVGQPKAILVAAAVVFGMGFISGFPTWIFMILAALMAVLSYFKLRKEKKIKDAEASGSAVGVDGHELSPGAKAAFRLTLPVILELGSGLSQTIKPQIDKFTRSMIPKMSAALYHDLGLEFPGVHLRTDSPNVIEKHGYSILVNESPIANGIIPEKKVLTNAKEETLKRYGIPFELVTKPIGPAALWVDLAYANQLKKLEIKYWEPVDVILLHLSQVLKGNAREFLGIQETKTILSFVEKSFPDLVKEVTRLVPLQKLTDIFKRLVEEEISIKDQRSILEALSDYAQTEKDTVLLAEYTRSALKRSITYKFSQGRSLLSAYILDQGIENMVRSSIKQTSSGSFLALDAESTGRILQKIRDTISKQTPSNGQSPVLITAMDVRRFVRKMIDQAFPELAVISYQEITEDVQIQPLDTIKL